MSETEWIEGITKEPLMQKLVPNDPMELPIQQENRSVEYRYAMSLAVLGC